MASTTRSFTYLFISMACALFFLCLARFGVGSSGWTLLIASLVLVERFSLSSAHPLFSREITASSLSEPPSPTTKQKQRSRPRPRGLDLSLAARRLSQLQAYTITQTTPTLFSIKTPCDTSTFYDDDHLISHSVKINHNSTAVSTPVRATRVKALGEMMEGQLGPLPEGWEMRLSSNMRVFFFDWRNGRTTWQDPRLPVQLDPSSGEDTPVPPTMGGRERVAQWLATEERKKRARESRMNQLRRHIRMAKLQRISQPLGVL